VDAGTRARQDPRRPRAPAWTRGRERGEAGAARGASMVPPRESRSLARAAPRRGRGSAGTTRCSRQAPDRGDPGDSAARGGKQGNRGLVDRPVSRGSIGGYSKRPLIGRPEYRRILQTAVNGCPEYRRILETAVDQPWGVSADTPGGCDRPPGVSADTRNGRRSAVGSIGGYSRRL
jgi:hypothetical protein